MIHSISLASAAVEYINYWLGGWTFAEEDYDHDLFGRVGSDLGLDHWQLLWYVREPWTKELQKQHTRNERT